MIGPRKMHLSVRGDEGIAPYDNKSGSSLNPRWHGKLKFIEELVFDRMSR